MDFHTATVAYYIARLSLPNLTDQTAFTQYLTLFWTYFDVGCCIHGMCLCGCGYPSPNENMWQIWSNDGGEKRVPEIFVYIQPIYTYT